MLFSNLIFFILALLIYSSYTPQDGGDVQYCLVSFVSVFIGWYLATRFAFRHYKKRVDQSPWGTFRVTPLLNALETRFTISSLFLYFFLVYGTRFKNIIKGFSYIQASSFLDIVIGIAPFFLLLIILWSNSFTLFRMTSVGLTKKNYLSSHLRLNAPILLPVLFFSLLQDLLRIFPFTEQTLSLLDMVMFVPFMILLMISYPFFLRRIWGAHSMPGGEQRDKFETFCRKAGLKVSDILIWHSFPGRIITAGIMGFITRLRYLFITPELLDLLSDEEMEGVIAHEAGHVKKHHMIYFGLLFLGFPLVFSLITIIAGGMASFMNPQFVDRFINSPAMVSLSGLVLPALMVLVYFRLFFGVLSRNFERQADLFVFDVVGHPYGIISSLEKISYAGSHAKDQPNWHHYSIGQRIKFLRDCVEDRNWRDLHEKKVTRLKRTLVAFLCLSFLLLGTINLPPIKDKVALTFLEKQVERIMVNNPHQIALPLALADYLFDKKKYHRAAYLYQQIIQHNPDNVTALNNLAWLYATADDPSVRNNEEALVLAKKATSLSREPHILDTLAEAYFLNGNSEKALKAINEAIALKPVNIDYYYEQKKKFSGKKLSP